MVKNGSFSPSENEASDNDNEEINEPLTQIEFDTGSTAEAGANEDTEAVTSD